MNNNPTQPVTTQSPESTPQEPSVQPAEQNIQSDFPDPIAMAAQSPQTQVAPITSAQANRAINKIDSAEHDQKNIRKLVIFGPIIAVAVLAIGIPLIYFPLNEDLTCQKVETNPEYTITHDIKVEFSNFQAAIVVQENILHFNNHKFTSSEYSMLKKYYSGDDYDDAQLTKVDDSTVKITFRNKRYTGQVGKTRPEAKTYIEESGFTCK